jgi:tRNA uridine 5-carboxymethylaminomethyl modification enzyme
LTVRQDNALSRLGDVAIEAGLLRVHEAEVIARRRERERDIVERASALSISPDRAAAVLAAAGETPLAHAVRIAELAKRPGVSLAALFAAAGHPVANDETVLTAELELKYAGYFERERAQADRLRRMRDVELPNELPYSELRSLSTEARQKLAVVRPTTLAQAASVSGVSASDLQNLLIEVERHKRRSQGTTV